MYVMEIIDTHSMIRLINRLAMQILCERATLPVCNVRRPREAKMNERFGYRVKLTSLLQVLSTFHNQTGNWTTSSTCQLLGIPLSGDRHLGNLGQSNGRVATTPLLTANRFDPPLWRCDCNLNLLDIKVGEKEGRSRAEVSLNWSALKSANPLNTVAEKCNCSCSAT
jgi:hypothetical protein